MLAGVLLMCVGEGGGGNPSLEFILANIFKRLGSRFLCLEQKQEKCPIKISRRFCCCFFLCFFFHEDSDRTFKQFSPCKISKCPRSLTISRALN